MNFWTLIFLDKLRQAKSFSTGKISFINRKQSNLQNLLLQECFKSFSPKALLDLSGGTAPFIPCCPTLLWGSEMDRGYLFQAGWFFPAL